MQSFKIQMKVYVYDLIINLRFKYKQHLLINSNTREKTYFANAIFKNTQISDFQRTSKIHHIDLLKKKMFM